MNRSQGAKGDIRPKKSNRVFFCFVLADLVTVMIYYVNRSFDLTTVDRLLAAVVMVVLMSAAYSGSVFSGLCLPWMAALLGALSALGFCMVVRSLLNGGRNDFNILPVFLLAVPIQFIISAYAMCGMRNNRENISFKAQMLTTFASLVAATGMTVWIIIG